MNFEFWFHLNYNFSKYLKKIFLQKIRCWSSLFISLCSVSWIWPLVHMHSCLSRLHNSDIHYQIMNNNTIYRIIRHIWPIFFSFFILKIFHIHLFFSFYLFYVRYIPFIMHLDYLIVHLQFFFTDIILKCLFIVVIH